MPVRDERGRELSGAAKRKRYGYARGNRGRRPPAKPWCFIDTEGAHDPAGELGPEGRQWTFCITAAAESGFERSFYRGRPLGTAELLAFICDLPRKYKLGAFGFGYDIDQITYQLPAESLELLHAGERVAWRSFMLRKHANRLSVARLTPRPAKLDWRPVWDVVRFYRGGLLGVVKEWGVASDQELELIERFKAARGDFTLEEWAQHGREIVEYSVLENRLGARLQTRFDALAKELGFSLSAWYGAGSMAAAMLSRKGVQSELTKRKRLAPIVRQLPYTYFGGRFEILGPGEYAPIFEYDLNSAYPAALLELPCLTHSSWRPSNSPPVSPWDLCDVRWKLDHRNRYGPFPLRRRDGTVYYPLEGMSFVWGEELRAAWKMWRPWQDISISRRWVHSCRCSCEPFAWVPEIFEERRRQGKDTRGYPLKLGLNSIYGKLASTLGAELEGGRIVKGWCEPRWSSMITAWTRARLLDALERAGGPRTDRVIMFATDAIAARGPIPGLELGDGLGQWSESRYESGLLVQPGIYFMEGARAAVKRRGRGIAAADVERRRQFFYAAWRAHGPEGKVIVRTQPRYQSVRLALHRGRELERFAWRWERERRELSFWPAGKRVRWRNGGWRPAPNEELRRSLFHAEEPHAPHGPFAELLGGDGGPPAVSPEQVELGILEDTQPVY